jgi:hypothetical protein
VASSSSNSGTSEVAGLLGRGGISAARERFGSPSGVFQAPVVAGLANSEVRRVGAGHEWVLQWGRDAKGAALVIGHFVNTPAGSSLTSADLAFTASITDGTTSLEQANTYLGRAGGGGWSAPAARPAKAWVPAYLWAHSDGSGLIIYDESGLSAANRGQLGLSSDPFPFSWSEWPAGHQYVE